MLPVVVVVAGALLPLQPLLTVVTVLVPPVGGVVELRQLV